MLTCKSNRAVFVSTQSRSAYGSLQSVFGFLNVYGPVMGREFLPTEFDSVDGFEHPVTDATATVNRKRMVALIAAAERSAQPRRVNDARLKPRRSFRRGWRILVSATTIQTDFHRHSPFAFCFFTV